jgi:hypothetical protein
MVPRMTATEPLGPVAAVAGVGMSLSPLLQLRRMRRTRSAADLSLAAQGVIAAGAAVLLSYALALGSVPLIITYATGTLASAACFLVGTRLRRLDTAAQRRGKRMSSASTADPAQASGRA